MITKFIAANSSDLGKVRMMVSRPTGIIMAAPMPCNTRAATSMGTVLARPHNTEARVKIATAHENTRRVP